MNIVTVNRLNNEAGFNTHIAMIQFTNVYEPIPLIYGKLATKYPCIYGYIYSAELSTMRLSVD